MRDIAIIHMAKKNLCFELEYIQTVCQSLDIGFSSQFGQYSRRLARNEDDPLTALSEAGDKKKGVRFVEEKEESKGVDPAKAKMRSYLEEVYKKLSAMMKDYLREG